MLVQNRKACMEHAGLMQMQQHALAGNIQISSNTRISPQTQPQDIPAPHGPPEPKPSLNQPTHLFRHVHRLPRNSPEPPVAPHDGPCLSSSSITSSISISISVSITPTTIASSRKGTRAHSS
jgi:hypothetical protein